MARTVLIVDDEAAIRRMLEKHLRGSGYEILQAMGGEEALKIIDSDRVECVITDCVMPGLSGEEVLIQIKKKHPRLPVIIMTGLPNDDSIDACLRHGAEDYLIKPFDKASLDDILERAFHKADRLGFLHTDRPPTASDGPPSEDPLKDNW